MQLYIPKITVPIKKSNQLSLHTMYQLLRSFLFRFDPEKVHYFSMNALRLISSLPGGRPLLKRFFSTPANTKHRACLQREFLGISFPNPVGLGAGFDKNASYLKELEALGFGAVEIGTVTPRPQAGNEKPRLFRLPNDKALINRMGFNNEGVQKVAARLKAWRQQTAGKAPSRMVIGGNIGKNKITPNEEAWKDYAECFRLLYPYVDYFVVNVSSPNTPGLRELQEKDSLRTILCNLQALRKELLQQDDQLATGTGAGLHKQKPILLKIAPDLSREQVNDVLDLAVEIKLDGLVVSNTTISRNGLITDPAAVAKMGAGGLSGLPVKARSNELVQYIHQATAGQIPIIASGGIFTGADAREKLEAGASLVQVWTGFIYVGPSIIKKICLSLLPQ